MAKMKGTGLQLSYSTTPLADVDPATVKGHNWTLNENVQSTEADDNREDSTVTTRKDGGTDEDLGGKRSSEFTLQVAYDPDDAFVTASYAAYKADTTIALADASAAIGTAGTKTMAGNFFIKNWRKSGPETGAATVSMRCKPTGVYDLEIEIPA